MNKKIKRVIPYFIFAIIFIVLILITSIKNVYCISVIYISISLHLIFNYYKKKKLYYKRYLYILWTLLTIMLNIFFFSVFNIVISLVLFILIMIQYYLNIKDNNNVIDNPVVKPKKVIINTELPSDFDIDYFENIVKELYINMQTYFMELNYKDLEGILCKEMYEQFSSQMEYLEKNEKRAIRDNIEFIDFKINEYKKIDDLEIIKVSIGVYEDKYTKYISKDIKSKVMRYENYYELIIENKDKWIISNLKLLYSHSKRD